MDTLNWFLALIGCFVSFSVCFSCSFCSMVSFLTKSVFKIRDLELETDGYPSTIDHPPKDVYVMQE